MTRSVVDYENLMDTSFCDSNLSVKTSLRPRWERKKLQQQQQQQQQQLDASKTGPTSLSLSQSSSSNNKNNNSCKNTKKKQPLGPSSTTTHPPLNGDRYIPNRAGMNMDLNKHLIRTASSSYDEEDGTVTILDDNEKPGSNDDRNNEQQTVISEKKKGTYESTLNTAIWGVEDVKSNRIMSYQEKAPAPKGDTINNLSVLYSVSAAAGSKKKSKTHLVSRAIPSAPSRILDAPDLKDDYYINVVSWSDTNVLAIALFQTVYLWNAGNGEIDELCTFNEGIDPHISSVSWVQEGGTHLAVGTSSGMTQVWDVNTKQQLRSMDGHTDRVSALSWNRHTLSSAGRDTLVVNHDVRVFHHNIGILSNHTQEVCGLAWSLDGEILASGGNDNVLCLWDARASSRSTPRFRFTDHQAAVKAVAWSPHEPHLLATGGGTADRTIKFWSSSTGALLNSIDTGSQVCSLVWNPFEKEILSSHGFARNQLSLWKYPSMALIKELEGHSNRVLHMARSPDGKTVMSAGADESLRFWDVFANTDGSSTSGSYASIKGKVIGAAAGLLPTAAGGVKSHWTAQIR